MSAARIRVVLIAALVLGAATLLCWPRAQATPLPAALSEQLEHHAVATAVDTAEVHRLRQVAAAADSTSRAAKLRADSLDRTARREHQRADSLAAATRYAQSVRDSADDWHLAYESRTLEADTLRAAGAAKDSALTDARLQIAAVDSALVRTEGRAARADAALAAAVAVVAVSDPPCHFLHFFSCPSRRVVAIGSAILGAGGALAARHALQQ